MDVAVDGQTRLSPLTEVAVGATVRVAQIGGGPATVRRCLALGINVGTVVTVRRRRGRGVVVASGGNRLAIGAEIAERIVTEPVD